MLNTDQINAISRPRCAKYRRRILDISQQVGALHMSPALSCVEIVDCIYHNLMRLDRPRESRDIFVMSKGHGCMSQFVVLEDLGIMPKKELDNYGTDGGSRLGVHPDYGLPGIEASTGSLGHGFGMCIGMAYADKISGQDNMTYCLISDGELQEGSTWEAMLMGPTLGLNNLVVFVDNNDFQSFCRTSESHPNFYPLLSKFEGFGWEAFEVDGHNVADIYQSVQNRKGDKPCIVNCKTIKGKGVSYMENAAVWHYRSPNKDEYQIALSEIEQGCVV